MGTGARDGGGGGGILETYLAQRKVAERRFVQLPVVRLALTGATNPIELIYPAFAYIPVPCLAAALPWSLLGQTAVWCLVSSTWDLV